jgi:hypothetical protein
MAKMTKADEERSTTTVSVRLFTANVEELKKRGASSGTPWSALLRLLVDKALESELQAPLKRRIIE